MKNSACVKWIYQKSKKQHAKMWVLIFANVIFSCLSVGFAFAIKAVINGAINPDHDAGKHLMIVGGISVGVVIILQFALRLLINGLSEHIKGKLEITYKTYLFNRILTRKYDKISAYHSGELLNRLSSDVKVVSDGVVDIVPNVVAASTRLIAAVVALIILDWIFAVAFVCAGILVFFTILFMRGKLKRLHKESAQTDGKVKSFMQECIENLLAVKVFSANGNVENKAGQLQQDNFKIKMLRKNYAVSGHAVYNLVFSLGYAFALIYGCIKIFNGTMGFGVGELTAVLQLVNNVQVPFASLSNLLPTFYSMVASAERIMEIENIDEEKIDSVKDEVISSFSALVIDGVSFRYDRDSVFEDACFTLNKGEFVTILGQSGIGKSTLIKLLLGVYPCGKGKMYLQTDNGEVPLDASTRKVFSYVPQGNMIFSGTIYDNVAFIKNNATSEEIENALKISCAYDFINTLPDGVNTVIGENGLGLSMGQAQRIAIARAIICNSPIIVLDEATSALDDETEKQLLSNLKSLKDTTVLFISHRKAAQSVSDKNVKIIDKKIQQVL